LVVLLDGTFRPETLIDELAGSKPRLGAETAAVHFVGDDLGALTGIDVESHDRPGLLYALSEALFRAGLIIVRSEIATRAERVIDRFYVRELDGMPVPRRRAAAIRAVVLEALDPSGAFADAAS
jgi:UTP:GlnB (protein PII) uridylyltransferase